MKQEKIELYKVRNFSDRVNVVFKFIKQNSKQIARNYLRLIPFLVIGSILTGYIQKDISYSSYSYSYNEYEAMYSNVTQYGIVYILIYLLICIALFLGNLFAFSFVAEYEESPTISVNDSDVWDRVKKSFWGVIGGSFIGGIAIFLGLMFCIIPGIWIAVSFSLFPIAYVFERKREVSGSITDCISESFSLIKPNWFPAFGYLIVMGIIGYVFSAALSLPSTIISMFMAYIPTESTLATIMVIVVYSLVYILSYVGSLISSLIVNVSCSLLYFDLKERSEGISIQKKIDSIGESQL